MLGKRTEGERGLLSRVAWSLAPRGAAGRGAFQWFFWAGLNFLPADPEPGGGGPGRGCWRGSTNWGRMGGVGLECFLGAWVEEERGK